MSPTARWRFALPPTLLRAATALAILASFWWRSPSRLPRIALAFIAGGALGNAVDGVARGFVVGTLLSHALSNLYRTLFGADFPLFNLADIEVISGTALLLLSSLRPHYTARSSQVAEEAISSGQKEGQW